MREELSYWLKYISLIVILAVIGDYLYRRFVV